MLSGTHMLNYKVVTCMQHSIKMEFSLVFIWMNKKILSRGIIATGADTLKAFLGLFFFNRRQIFKDNCKYLILAVVEAVPGNITFIILINKQLRCPQTAFSPHICIKSTALCSGQKSVQKNHIYIWRKRARQKTAHPPQKKHFIWLKPAVTDHLLEDNQCWVEKVQPFLCQMTK